MVDGLVDWTSCLLQVVSVNEEPVEMIGLL